ncbi:MAG: L-2-amino-thiazoline-4-carboxylic acid hydrolase [Synergistaceae bacterium]|nr:L-2-amino-thiazoline-4-carboxylic acid hydrolase [Synergistaceae bacterium]
MVGQGRSLSDLSGKGGFALAKKRPITLLERREIEATFFKTLLGPLLEKISEEDLREAVGKALCQAAHEAGQAAARDGNSLEDFKKVIRGWAEGGALEMDELEDSPDCLRFNVTRCAYAELYERLGLKEWGTVLSCDRDFAVLEGFNDGLELTRPKTLMEDKEHCNYCYRPKK